MSETMSLKRWSFLASLLVLLSVLVASPLGAFLELDVGARILYRVRAFLDRSPEIHPSLKVFGIDDPVVAHLQGATGNYQDWSSLLKKMAQSKPQIILIDKAFSISSESDGAAVDFLKTLENLQVPVIAGGFMGGRHLTSHHAVPERFLAPASGEGKPSRGVVLFGPESRIVSGFSGIAHLSNLTALRVPAYLDIPGQGRSYTLGLYAKKATGDLAHGTFYWGEDKIPLYEQKDILINFPSISELLSKTFSLFKIVQNLNQNTNVSVNIKEGDVVLILPQMFTGNVDWKDSPIGKMEGGYLHVAVANSVLKNDFLHSYALNSWERGLLVFVILILFIYVSSKQIVSHSYVFGSLLILGFGGVGLVLFVYQSIWIPWVSLCFSLFVFVALEVFRKVENYRRKAIAIEHTLSGLVPHHLLKWIQRSQHGMWLPPREVDVSVMFIDIEEFSLKSDSLSPQEVFSMLKEEFTDIANIIHLHNGIIDKNLGDGLLCYFGFDFEQENYTKDNISHAYSALACAVEIQRLNAEKIFKVSKDLNKLKRIFSFRIGINSGMVYLGNLGFANRLDITLIGSTVNLAKRFEESGEILRIMLGANTLRALSGHPEGSKFDPQASRLLPAGCAIYERWMGIKHYEKLLVGYEIDPFQDAPGRLLQAILILRSGTDRKRDRVGVANDLGIRVWVGPESAGTLVNFSPDGIGFQSSIYYAKKVFLSLILENEHGTLQIKLRNLGLSPIPVQVRWGLPQDKGFRHGAEIVGWDLEKKRALLQVLMELQEEEQEKSF